MCAHISSLFRYSINSDAVKQSTNQTFFKHPAYILPTSENFTTASVSGEYVVGRTEACLSTDEQSEINWQFSVIITLL